MMFVCQLGVYLMFVCVSAWCVFNDVFVCQLGVGRAEKLGLHIQPLACRRIHRMAF